MNKQGKHGGARTGSGRKRKWYGNTVAMRVPEAWAMTIQRCMEEGITPVFENVQSSDTVNDSTGEMLRVQRDSWRERCEGALKLASDRKAAIAELEAENARLAELLEAAHSRIEDLECSSGEDTGEDTL